MSHSRRNGTEIAIEYVPKEKLSSLTAFAMCFLTHVARRRGVGPPTCLEERSSERSYAPGLEDFKSRDLTLSY